MGDAMGYVVKRTVTLKIDRGDEEDFLEYLERKLESVDYSYRFKEGGQLIVNVFGDAKEVSSLVRRIRIAYRDFYLIKGGGGRYKRYPITWVQEIGPGVPLYLIEKVVSALGSKITRKKDLFITTMTKDDFVETILELRQILDETRPIIAQRNVRDVMVVASILSGESVLELLDKALEDGLIEEVDNIYYLRRDPESIIRALTSQKEG